MLSSSVGAGSSTYRRRVAGSSSKSPKSSPRSFGVSAFPCVTVRCSRARTARVSPIWDSTGHAHLDVAGDRAGARQHVAARDLLRRELRRRLGGDGAALDHDAALAADAAAAAGGVDVHAGEDRRPQQALARRDLDLLLIRMKSNSWHRQFRIISGMAVTRTAEGWRGGEVSVGGTK